jgi:hypothetical protein
MRVIIERAALLKSLNHVQSVVERRNTIPTLIPISPRGLYRSPLMVTSPRRTAHYSRKTPP